MKVNYQKSRTEYAIYDSTTSLSGFRTLRIMPRVRYEFNYRILKPKYRFSPYVGTASLLNFDHISTDPFSTTSFKSSFANFSATLQLMLGLEFNTKKRLFFNFNVPIKLLVFGVNSSKSENPAILVTQQRITTVDFDRIRSEDLKSLLSPFNCRFGVGIRI